jgi:hypothetical protein
MMEAEIIDRNLNNKQTQILAAEFSTIIKEQDILDLVESM